MSFYERNQVMREAERLGVSVRWEEAAWGIGKVTTREAFTVQIETAPGEWCRAESFADAFRVLASIPGRC